MNKYSQDKINSITKKVLSKLRERNFEDNLKTSKLDILDLLKKFIKLPTKEEAKKIILHSTKKDVEEAVKYLPQLKEDNKKESFNLSSIKKHILLLASIAVLSGVYSEKAIGLNLKDVGNAVNLASTLVSTYQSVKDGVKSNVEAENSAFKRLERAYSKLEKNEKIKIKKYFANEDYDLDMIEVSSEKKNFENDEKKEEIFEFLSKINKIKSLYEKDISNQVGEKFKVILEKSFEEAAAAAPSMKAPCSD